MSFFYKLVNWYFKKDSLPYWAVLIIDCLICYLAGLFVLLLFFSNYVNSAHLGPFSSTLLVYLFFNIIGFRLFHTYSGIIRYSSFVDLQRVAGAMGFGLVVATVIHFLVLRWSGNQWIVPLRIRHIVTIYLASTIAMWGFRILVKLIYDSMYDIDKAKNTLIYGVKEGGAGIAKNIANEKPQRFKLKGFIAHDNSDATHYLMGQKVYPINENLLEVLKANKISCVLVSPLRNDEFRNDDKLQDMLISAGVRIFMSEGVREWDSNAAKKVVGNLKEISIEDLLPRDKIEVDLLSIGNLLQGKRIMITGSAGSIGSEMVRQICPYKPGKLMLIDQAETPQHDIRLMMKKEYPDIKTKTVVATIANQDRMERIFSEFKPDYVFHAAAYKHVPMMEDNPSESIQVNILGTKIIADLSVKYGVKKFVMLSTDKAVNPSNVMGCSKRICEIYIQSLDKAEKDGTVKGNTQFVTTRFGNVLGSNGSVIPLFKRQIAEGGPLTVTHPDIIRYFMLIAEACNLVLEAGTKGNGGEIFVFDMGKPVKIADLAKRMIKLSGAKNVEIKYVGLRDGEKLYEELINSEESTLPSFNPKIRIAQVREYAFEMIDKQISDLLGISHTYDEMAIVDKMKEIVPEFKSMNSVYAELDK